MDKIDKNERKRKEKYCIWLDTEKKKIRMPSRFAVSSFSTSKAICNVMDHALLLKYFEGSLCYINFILDFGWGSKRDIKYDSVSILNGLSWVS